MKITIEANQNLLALWMFFVITSILHLVEACSFPESLIMGRDDPPWFSHVLDDGSRDIKYYIRRSFLEIHNTRSNNRFHTRWKCLMALQDKLLLKRQDHRANEYYRCAKFYIRSPSIVQIAWSNESKIFDIGHCDNDLLYLDPWPLVRFQTLDTDYSQCPFSGGYDLKITDSQYGPNGCNLLHRPMRMEVECTGGEGVVFDFTSSNCLPDIRMHHTQSTLCVASWQHEGYHFSVLRKHEDTRLWCLAVPIDRGIKVKGYLYSDLVCHGGNIQEAGKRVSESPDTLKYFTLDLQQRNYPTLCEDEYSECSSVECNEYFKKECKKSCNACNGTSRVKSCMFPKRTKGHWFLKNPNDFTHVEMKDMELAIQGVGRFQCAAFPDSPSRKSRIYSTVSVYENGCRPRFTCVKLQLLAPSVIRYSLSQSYVWPAVQQNFGQMICEPDRFHADQPPVEDLYRSHAGSGKPIIVDTSDPTAVNCNITRVHTLTATLPEGFICSGTMFTHCEDPTRLRLNFESCSGLIARNTDYKCLADYEGHYWERILLVQNVQDRADARCFVFNRFKPDEAYVMVAGECDQKAFNFARAGVRKPLLSLKFRKDKEICRSVPPTILPSTTAEGNMRLPHDAKPLASGHSSSYNNRTHADQGHQHSPMSIFVTISPSEKSDRRKGGEIGGAISQSKTQYGTDRSSDDSGNHAKAWSIQPEVIFVLVCISFIHSLVSCCS